MTGFIFGQRLWSLHDNPAADCPSPLQSGAKAQNRPERATKAATRRNGHGAAGDHWPHGNRRVCAIVARHATEMFQCAALSWPGQAARQLMASDACPSAFAASSEYRSAHSANSSVLAAPRAKGRSCGVASLCGLDLCRRCSRHDGLHGKTQSHCAQHGIQCAYLRIALGRERAIQGFSMQA